MSMKQKPRVYLGGPISRCTYAAATGWRRHLTEMLAPDIECLDPLRGKEVLAACPGDIGYPDFPARESALDATMITMRDKSDVRAADLVVFNFESGLQHSIGCLVEIGWATAWGKPVLFWRGAIDPVFLHPFLLALPTAQYFGGLDGLAERIRDLLAETPNAHTPQ